MCRICEEIKNNEFKLYEDKEIIVFLAAWGVKGLCIVAPKQHYTLLEQVPEEVFSKCFFMANKVAGLVFQVLGCQGTNIIINNGDGANQEFSHFIIQVIPRFENDNLKLEWERKPADQGELKVLANKLEPSNEEKPIAESQVTIPEKINKEHEVSESKESLKSERKENETTKDKTHEKKKKMLRWLIRIP